MSSGRRGIHGKATRKEERSERASEIERFLRILKDFFFGTDVGPPCLILKIMDSVQFPIWFDFGSIIRF